MASFRQCRETKSECCDLDEPREKEDHRDEENESFPRRQTVQRLVHDEHPSLLGRRYVHREETRCCNKQKIIQSQATPHITAVLDIQHTVSQESIPPKH